MQQPLKLRMRVRLPQGALSQVIFLHPRRTWRANSLLRGSRHPASPGGMPVTRHLLTSPVAILLVVALAAPATAEGPSLPGLAEHVERVGRLPTDLIKSKKTDAEIAEALFL